MDDAEDEDVVLEIDEGTTPFPVETDGAGSDEIGEERERAEMLTETLTVVRDLIVRNNPDLVPDLVRGETLADLLASVGPAREAYRRIAEAVAAVAPVVPAGGVGVEVIEGPGEVLIKRAIAIKRREN